MSSKPDCKAGFRIAVAAVVLTFGVVMLGAFTRLVDAGLGCPDWPVCYGHVLWPMNEQEVLAANERFPDTPVDHEKTWPEQVHRLFATGLGIVCIVLVAIAVVQRVKHSRSDYPLKLPILLLAMVILQGLFGMWTVTLKLWPQVVTAHLLGGFATLSLLVLLVLRLYGRCWHLSREQFSRLQSLKPLIVLSFIVVILQITLGGWTTSNYAALACPDFPKCQSSWLPIMDFATGFNFAQDIGPNYLGGLMDSAARAAIHFSHRIGAIVTTLVVLLLAFKMVKTQSNTLELWAWSLVAILVLQVCLGVSNVMLALPLSVAVAHNAVGALLLVCHVALCHRIFTARVSHSN